jgi:hypothetical protein
MSFVWNSLDLPYRARRPLPVAGRGTACRALTASLRHGIAAPQSSPRRRASPCLAEGQKPRRGFHALREGFSPHAQRRARAGGLRLAWPTSSAPIGYQLSPIGYHLSPIGYHLSPIGYHLSPIGYHLSPIGYHLSPIGYHLSPIGYHLSPIGYHLSPIAYLSQTFQRIARITVTRHAVPIRNTICAVRSRVAFRRWRRPYIRCISVRLSF